MNLIDYVLSSPRRQAMPIALYPGLKITQATVRQMVTDVNAQYDAAMSLYRRYGNATVLTAMDLSVEAETFGAAITMDEHEIPTVSGRLLTTAEEIAQVRVPEITGGRGHIYVQVARKLHLTAERPPLVVGGIIGPYTLAARLFGVSEALELTLLDAAAAHELLAKTTQYLIKYAQAFKDVGANAVCMAEPAAGLLWPDGLREFSSRYVKQIAEAVEDDTFKIVLHNCGAKIEHLPAVLDSGVRCFHFGAPMDLVKALEQVPADVVLCGNLNPAEVFVAATAAEVGKLAAELLERTSGRRNFVLSSGCDIPPNAPLANLDAFYQALHDFNAK